MGYFLICHIVDSWNLIDLNFAHTVHHHHHDEDDIKLRHMTSSAGTMHSGIKFYLLNASSTVHSLERFFAMKLCFTGFLLIQAVFSCVIMFLYLHIDPLVVAKKMSMKSVNE